MKVSFRKQGQNRMSKQNFIGGQAYAVWRELWAHWRYFEYWPTRLFYLPIYVLVGYWALRFRSLDFMSMINPCMEFGGLLNYSKSKILARLPKDKTLQSCTVDCAEPLEQILRQMGTLQFPIVAKPDCGERGFAVEIVHDREALLHYLNRFRAVSRDLGEKQNIILQEYFHPAKEFAVLYSISPLQAEHRQLGQIRSICAKEPLVLQGDGRSPLWQLVARHPRGAYRFRMLRRKWRKRWHEVPECELPLTEIGAHSLGTTCYSLQEQNSKRLLKIFAELTASINSGPNLDFCLEFCFGRYDILAKDWDSVLAGDFKVIELNGVNSEPIHIYHPNSSVWQAWKTLWAHWAHLAMLAREMQSRGATPGSNKILFKAIFAHDKRIGKFARRK